MLLFSFACSFYVVSFVFASVLTILGLMQWPLLVVLICASLTIMISSIFSCAYLRYVYLLRKAIYTYLFINEIYFWTSISVFIFNARDWTLDFGRTRQALPHWPVLPALRTSISISLVYVSGLCSTTLSLLLYLHSKFWIWTE